VSILLLMNIIRAASACRDTDICMAALFAYVLMSGHCMYFNRNVIDPSNKLQLC
jgi:hypothetical protein